MDSHGYTGATHITKVFVKSTLHSIFSVLASMHAVTIFLVQKCSPSVGVSRTFQLLPQPVRVLLAEKDTDECLEHAPLAASLD